VSVREISRRGIEPVIKYISVLLGFVSYLSRAVFQDPRTTQDSHKELKSGPTCEHYTRPLTQRQRCTLQKLGSICAREKRQHAVYVKLYQHVL